MTDDEIRGLYETLRDTLQSLSDAGENIIVTGRPNPMPGEPATISGRSYFVAGCNGQWQLAGEHGDAGKER